MASLQLLKNMPSLLRPHPGDTTTHEPFPLLQHSPKGQPFSASDFPELGLILEQNKQGDHACE